MALSRLRKESRRRMTVWKGSKGRTSKYTQDSAESIFVEHAIMLPGRISFSDQMGWYNFDSMSLNRWYGEKGWNLISEPRCSHREVTFVNVKPDGSEWNDPIWNEMRIGCQLTPDPMQVGYMGFNIIAVVDVDCVRFKFHGRYMTAKTNYLDKDTHDPTDTAMQLPIEVTHATLQYCWNESTEEEDVKSLLHWGTPWHKFDARIL